MGHAHQGPPTGRFPEASALFPADEAWEAMKQAGLRRARLERSAMFHELLARVAAWSPFRRRAAECRFDVTGRPAGHRG